MDDRIRALDAWLRTALPGTGFRLESASSDASFRRYFRVFLPERTLIAMDAPPEREDSRAFVRVARLLRDAGLNAPEVLAHDLDRGFLLLTDLGTRSYLAALREGDVDRLFAEATTALVRWQAASRPGELPEYDAALLRGELDLFPEWYLGRHLGVALSPRRREALEAVFRAILARNLAEPRVYVHRDYMPRNLMVTEPNPGILDFQDAVHGPISYDVASLFRDAFVSWEEERVLDGTMRYWEKARLAGLPVRADFSEFRRDAEWMGLQRHLKVLGIFARLRYRDGKAGYLEDTPRFVAYVRHTVSRYRELAPLGRLLDEAEGRAPVAPRHLMPRALILAAGRGERLRPLTDAVPKPLLRAGGRALVEWQIERLAAGGFRDLVVNHAHLGAQIEAALGDGSRFGVRIRYSPESPALEVAGGIARALPLLDAAPFVVVSGDIHTDFDFASLVPRIEAIERDPDGCIAHFVLVDNPPWHAAGDMGLAAGRVTREGPTLTYGNIGVFHPQSFREIPPGTRLKLFPWMYRYVDEGRVTGERYAGAWDNVGTAEQLADLDRRLAR